MSNRSVAGYIRVSTEEQAQEGVSLAAQKHKIEVYCDLNDLQLVGIIEDAGISGKTLSKRPGIQTVLSQLENGDITGLVILKLDRLSRSTRDILDLTDRIEKNGWELHSIMERLDTSSATGRFTLTLLASLAQLEREQISERTKAALAHKKENGEFLGAPPLGYEVGTSSTGQRELVPIRGEQLVLKRIDEMRRSGKTYQQIADALNEDEVRTKRGKRFQKATVFYLVKNVISKGICV